MQKVKQLSIVKNKKYQGCSQVLFFFRPTRDIKIEFYISECSAVGAGDEAP